jgi:cytochrome c oxidase cbb3-type subunit 3/ubiquinol-cytochrome c reductase cytochrome c subunit
MNRILHTSVFALLIILTSGCDNLPGKPGPGPLVPRPDSILDAATLYGENCAGCHGKSGLGAVATPIGLPEYQSLVDEPTQRAIIANGVPNTAMPGFSRKVGGFLTDEQIDALVKGMRATWLKGTSSTQQASPPYADTTAGDSVTGATVYESSCSRCHGKAGGPVGQSGSVLNASFLALVSPQALRTSIIVGRPDLNMPGWRSVNATHPLSEEEIRDVVAFLLSHRRTTPGQPYSTKSAAPTTGATR